MTQPFDEQSELKVDFPDLVHIPKVSKHCIFHTGHCLQFAFNYQIYLQYNFTTVVNIILKV